MLAMVDREFFFYGLKPNVELFAADRSAGGDRMRLPKGDRGFYVFLQENAAKD